jgi:hypothetical protein
VATFTCPSRWIGDVVVWVEGDGVVVGVDDMCWHGHFDEGTDEEIVAKCAGFLDDLFRDKVVVYRADDAVAGFFYRDDSGGVVRWLSQKADDVRAGTWSGPWEDDGIVAHGYARRPAPVFRNDA